MIRKYDVVLVKLDPTQGAEKRGTRPCLVLQNNFANSSKIQTITIAPFTTHIRNYPAMQLVQGNDKNGMNKESCLDLSQIKTVDRTRIVKTLGHLESEYNQEISDKISSFLDIRNEYC